MHSMHTSYVTCIQCLLQMNTHNRRATARSSRLPPSQRRRPVHAHSAHTTVNGAPGAAGAFPVTHPRARPANEERAGAARRPCAPPHAARAVRRCRPQRYSAGAAGAAGARMRARCGAASAYMRCDACCIPWGQLLCLLWGLSKLGLVGCVCGTLR